MGLRLNLYAPWRRADGDRERVDAGARDEVRGLVGVGEQHLARERALGAHAVLLARLTGLQRAENPELAFDGDAHGMRHLDDQARGSTLYS